MYANYGTLKVLKMNWLILLFPDNHKIKSFQRQNLTTPVLNMCLGRVAVGERVNLRGRKLLAQITIMKLA